MITVGREFVGKYSRKGTLPQYEFSRYESNINFLVFTLGVSCEHPVSKTVCSLKSLNIIHSDKWTRIFLHYGQLALYSYSESHAFYPFETQTKIRLF